MSNLGFVGLGIMGKPMAGHLIKAGHKLYVYDKVASSVNDLEAEGAIPCSNPGEVASNGTIIFLMLPDTPDVEEVLFGKDGVAEGVKEGSLVIDMSSISPIATRRFAERLRALHVEMLDAPVSGGQIGAQNGTLSIMVGGKESLFSDMKSYFEIMGKNIVHIGGNGDGQVCKVANQIVVALTLEAVSEALVLASKAGADPARVRQALLGGFAQSKILEVHGERMLNRNFAPGFRVRLHQKDLNLALQAARELGVSLPNTAMAQELFNTISADGGLDLDHSALVMALEKLANHRIVD
jgi:2-hydroxy-3-oxopropionate reductase